MPKQLYYIELTINFGSTLCRICLFTKGGFFQCYDFVEQNIVFQVNV